MTETATPDTGHSTKVDTTYVVFVSVAGQGEMAEGAGESAPGWDQPAWKPIGEITAKTPDAAMTLYAERSGSSVPLKLAAVPARYWSTDTKKPKTVTTWESAS